MTFLSSETPEQESAQERQPGRSRGHQGPHSTPGEGGGFSGALQRGQVQGPRVVEAWRSGEDWLPERRPSRASADPLAPKS